VTKEKVTLKTYYLYTKERFPVVPAFLVSAVMFCSAYFFSGKFNPVNPVGITEMILGTLVVFLVTFHLRIFDEHKDYDKDTTAYPDRMLSRGLITLKDLRVLAYAAILIEAVISLYLGMTAFIIWIVILCYTLLMLKEFFVPEFLNSQMGLYLVSHQLLVPLIMMQGYFLRKPQVCDPLMFIVFFAGALCAFMTYEIARKTWNPEREHELADSYTKSWGAKKTVMVNQALAVFSTAALCFVFMSGNSGIIPIIIQAAIYILFLAADIMFLNKPTLKNSKMLEGIGGLFTIAFYLNAAITFYITYNR
jgi:4-hydroxybenzoate polyprenyltransferase